MIGIVVGKYKQMSTVIISSLQIRELQPRMIPWLCQAHTESYVVDLLASWDKGERADTKAEV